MIIESLELKNFRNYKDLQLSFDSRTNLLYGNNAQGKTNILEALYVCAATKSHRCSRDREMIQFGEEAAHIKLAFLKAEIPYRIDIHLKREGAKGIAVNGVAIRKASELFGILNMVLFSPEDLSIIKNGPADRRRFMDIELCQLDRSYVHSLLNYNRALLQRNRLLKEIGFSGELKETLDIWDAQLLRYGKELIRHRKKFIRELNPVIQNVYSGITDAAEKIEIVYDGNITEESYESALRKNREADIRQKTTSIGPHRDDIGFFLEKLRNSSKERVVLEKNGMDLRKFGSQGQQRTAALSLKLSEIELMKKNTGEDPVLLLDDVLSELDTQRQKQLLKSISKIQTVITSTGMENLLEKDLQINRRFRVTDGAVCTVD